MVTLPPLPTVPACHTWPMPPLPQRCSFTAITDWQAGRCAICGWKPRRASELHHDHDHATGDTRGWLCPRCNTSEGGPGGRAPVFVAYRKAPPAVMLGVLHTYRPRREHPVVEQVNEDLRKAMEGVLIHTDADYRARWIADRRGLPGFTEADWTPPPWTPLMRAVHRVGLTSREWGATLEHRRKLAAAWLVHLPTETNPPRDACDEFGDWLPPSRGGFRRPCATCWQVDRERVEEMVGPDGFGPTRDPQAELIREANLWRANATSARTAA